MLLGYLLDLVRWSLELGVGGGDPEEGSLNAIGTPLSSPHLRLGCLIAHDCFDFAPIYVKKPEIDTC